MRRTRTLRRNLKKFPAALAEIANEVGGKTIEIWFQMLYGGHRLPLMYRMRRPQTKEPIMSFTCDTILVALELSNSLWLVGTRMPGA
jgi:hypothetical protein